MSKPKRKGGPLRIPLPEEETPKLTIIDLIEVSIPLINIGISIIFIILISEFYLDLLLFFMLVLTITFFPSFFFEFWQRKQIDRSKKPLLIFNPFDVSPFVLYAGQFFYGYFFLSFIFLGFIEALSILSIFIWVYFSFSTLFLVLAIWAILSYVKEAGSKKEELKNKIIEELNKHEKSENFAANFAAQGYYLQLLLKVIETPLIKARFLSKLITAITIILAILPFIIPV